MTRINPAGLSLIKLFEGLETEAYVDPVGIWTIGYGHIEGVQPGDRLTEQEAEALLLKDLIEYEAGIERWAGGGPRPVPLTENEFSALVSFSFNAGLGAFFGSTAALRLRAGAARWQAAEALTWWTKGRVNGRLVVLPGLVRRRAAEAALFLTPMQPPDQASAETSTNTQPAEEK